MSEQSVNKIVLGISAATLLVSAGIAYGIVQAEVSNLKGSVTEIKSDVDKQRNLNRKISRELGALDERSKLSIRQGQLIQERLFEIQNSHRR